MATTTMTSPAKLDTSSGRGSARFQTARAEVASGSGFYQLVPDPTTPDTRSPSPRPSPRAIRRLSNMTESTDAEDIDFFLKVVSEFRAYVSEKIEELQDQHQTNENRLEEIQRILKESEETWTTTEIGISKEINSLVSLLQKQQGIYVEQIKKQRSRETDVLRTKMDVCRRNMKIISGVLGFAKRIASEKDESLRQHTLKELKQRFTSASERDVPNITDHHDGGRGLSQSTLNDIRTLLEESISGATKSFALPATSKANNSPPTITAQSSPDDVTKNSIIVRWVDGGLSDGVMYELEWKYATELLPKSIRDIQDTQYVLNDLNSNCEITVRVRRCLSEACSEFSALAFFRTKPQPAKFHLDSDTAHAKLQLSPDLFSVHYPGESKNPVQKSPSRFTFALNVLGNISFFTGRHYWEILVNTDGWAVGVAYRNVPRNSWLGSNTSSWILHYNPSKREYKARHGGEFVDIKVRRPSRTEDIRRVGIFVDYEQGIVSFVDCRHMDVLHTYRTNGFEQPIAAAVNPFYHGGVLTMITGLDIPDINFGI